MTKNSLSYRVIELPPARRGIRNYLDLHGWKHSIYGLLAHERAAKEVLS